MRPPQFQTSAVIALLRRKQIATMAELKAALGTAVDMTVFRKLKAVDYVSSYSHRGRFYALRDVARFDDRGLWSCRGVHFSEFGSLVDTAAEFVTQSAQGYFVSELAAELQVAVKDPLLQLVEDRRLAREDVQGLYLYLALDRIRRSEQRAQRLAVLTSSSAAGAEPRAVEASVVGDEVRAAIVLFYTLLDERQRRLFAGLESLRTGWGGRGRRQPR
jgi:hypothetical protein